MPSLRRHIALVGFMGAGKTTAGTQFAKLANLPFVDIDATIVKREQMPISTIFASKGQTFFRQLEHEELMRALESRKTNVISCGGGVVNDHENVTALCKLCTIVYLKVSLQTAQQRIKGTERRPLLETSEPEIVEFMYVMRDEICSTIADVTIDTEGKTKAEVSEELHELLST